MTTEKQPHLDICPEDISPFVLLPGDPGRIDSILEKLDDPRIVATKREYRTGTGFYKGVKVTATSTGIGGPSTAIAVEELIRAGAKYLIRVGTCGGSWQKHIPAGSLAIPTASIRDEGTTIEYALPHFPAVANIDIVNALIRAARKLGHQHFWGINRCHDAFYCPATSKEKWRGLPIITSEMESAPLFLISSLRQVQAGAILAVNSDPEPFDMDYCNVTEKSAEFTAQVVDNMIATALEAIVLLSK